MGNKSSNEAENSSARPTSESASKGCSPETSPSESDSLKGSPLSRRTRIYDSIRRSFRLPRPRQANSRQASYRPSCEGNTAPYQKSQHIDPELHQKDQTYTLQLDPKGKAATPGPVNDISLLLVGCKENGKSHTGNTILRQEAFGIDRKGGTEKSSLGSSSHEVDGVSRKVTVVDTPGVSQEMTESEFEELVRAVKMVPEGFDAICLVWDYNNSEKNEDKEVQVFQSLHRLFGDGLYEHLVILVTRAQEEDIPEFLAYLPDAMTELIKQCCNRVISIENRMKGTSRTLTECISKLCNSTRRYVTSDLSHQCQIPEGDELGIVLVGKTGVGKSHTGNNITGAKFMVSDKAKSETRECEQHTRQKDRHITVLDTPGVFDTGNVKDICEELCRIVTFFPDGLHAVILVLRRGRFTKEEAETLAIFQHMFGEKFLKHSLLLITAKDELLTSEETYLTTAPQGLQDIVKKCGNRCVFFNNKSRDETILRMQLVQLIRLVDGIVQQNRVYTDDLFQEGRKEMIRIIKDLNDDNEIPWSDVSEKLRQRARKRAMDEDYRNTPLYKQVYSMFMSFWRYIFNRQDI